MRRWGMLLWVIAIAMVGGMVLVQGPAMSARQSSQPVVEVGMTEQFPFRFEPETVTVPVGTTVRWTTSGVAPHTVTSEGCMVAGYGPCLFDSGVRPDTWLRNGTPVTTFEFTFEQPGAYPYLCRLHGQPGGLGQVGTVNVTTPDGAAPAAMSTAPVQVDAQVEILAPRNGEVIIGPNVTVRLGVRGVAVREAVSGTIDPAFGHYHLLLDTTHPLQEEFPPVRPGLVHVYGDEVTLENVAPGEHTLIVVWGFDNHNPPQPPITATVRFTTAAGRPAQPPAQQPIAAP
jgi:plastocyanin